MGFDATRFAVGDEWVYRLRDDSASERVRVLAVMPTLALQRERVPAGWQREPGVGRVQIGQPGLR
jgi:hypothetical protein